MYKVLKEIEGVNVPVESIIEASILEGKDIDALVADGSVEFVEAENTTATPEVEPVVPVEEVEPVVPEKTATYKGKVIISDGYRTTASGTTTRELRLEDGTSQDLTEEEYATEVIYS